ncbi:MAG: RecX family transcriptional regulator [candidate division Zixibacteria bacterium]
MAELLIAGIEPVKRKKGWFELTTKGKPPFLIDEETIYKNSLRTGDVISDARFQRIRQHADLAWLKHRGMQILSRRMISERDLRRKLSAERKSPAIRDEAMVQLKRYGFFDDSRYAAALIRSQMSRGVKSRLYLKKKLWEKGIDKEIAEPAIETELEGFDEKDAVLELAKKKLRSLKRLPADKTKNRLISFLRGKGFSWDTINSAVKTVLANKSEDM